ncbi:MULTISPECIES: DUF2690 domain-containing protein [Streptomyces]|uniref:DUF2690 domain-containing protein n=1 Tax=Streptomyces siderophoricus TaxID=2802281 RepID=A0ABS1MRV3_9ACTN|nr:DUF2690 domain-containing protein [Streptomyces sp. 9-7]MBL1090515.1 DUF2690 domain-containing protein [Streptomyces sp. 9-7]
MVGIKTLGRLAVATAVPLLLAASGTVPVQAAAPVAVTAQCSGSGCSGRNPVGTGCDRDARTVRRSAEIGPLIELRYSARCRAAWVRVTHGSGGDRIEARNRSGACRSRSCYSRTLAPGHSSAYTAMVNDKGIKAWGCLYRRNGNAVCTDGY